MTTSILDAEKLQQLLTLSASDLVVRTAPIKRQESLEPVSLRDLLVRAQKLFTPEEAADLARRVEEGRAQRHD